MLVGPDARFLDKVVRLLGSTYQVLVMKQVRKMNGARRSSARHAPSSTA